MDDETKQPVPLNAVTKHVEVECPKCGHKFLHKLEDVLKAAGEDLGNAIGEAKFGG
jgi:hypothetical protein